ncbi:MAG: DegV family protein, partial [Dysosmobacter welbionis]
MAAKRREGACHGWDHARPPAGQPPGAPDPRGGWRSSRSVSAPLPWGADHPTTSTPDGRPGMRPKGAVCMIKITTDSTCDLPRELLERYNITVTPLGIIKAGKLYQ